MEARDLAWGIPALAGLVFFSSLLGLSGRFLNEFGDALGFMGGIWSASLLADIVFVVGTSLAAILSWGLAHRRGLIVAVLAGALAHWLVYFASFLLLPGDIREEGASDVGGSFLFVAAWGFMGLAFAALAPPLVALARAKRAAMGAPA